MQKFLQTVGLEQTISDAKGAMDLSWTFLALLSRRTGISFFLNERVARQVSGVLTSLRRGSSVAVTSLDEGVTTVHEESHQWTADDLPMMIGPIASVEELRAIQVDGLHSAMWECLRVAISGPEEALRRLPEFSPSPVVDSEPLCWGSIRRDQANAFTFDSRFGAIQIGSPPETVKATMERGDVPRIYVLPQRLFTSGINFGEVEFPIFFAYFISEARPKRDNKVILVGTSEQIANVKAVFQESVFGPSQLDVSPEIRQPGYKIDLRAELNFLANTKVDGHTPNIDEFADFLSFDCDGVVRLRLKRRKPSGWSSSPAADDEFGELVVKNVCGLLQFFEDGTLTGIIDSDFTRISVPPLLATPVPTFQPPTFGLTFLGTSHGFDPKGKTTGFIIWIQGRGVVVDPPFYSVDYLRDAAVLEFIDKLLLTHTHSDHDSGMLGLLLSGHRMQVITTATIHGSFVRKTTTLVGRDISDVYDFTPALIGESMEINGATFDFDYSYHVIPTMRFRVAYGGHSISYSADTKYDPQAFLELVQRKIITPEREASLRMGGFDADIVIHEMGVPPIHTDAAILNSLPEGIKRRMLIVHCAAVPEKVKLLDGRIVPVTSLHKPLEGIENTIIVHLDDPESEGFSRARRQLQLLSQVPFFDHLRPSQLYRLFCHVERKSFAANTTIATAGSRASYMYVIEKGVVSLTEEDGQTATLCPGETFGEAALIDEHVCKATATAAGDLTLLCLPHSHLLPHKKLFEQVFRFRAIIQQSLATRSRFLKELSKSQIELISTAVSEEIQYDPGEVIIQQGVSDRRMFFVTQGTVAIDRRLGQAEKSVSVIELGPGDCFGEIGLITGQPRSASVTARTAVSVLVLKREDLENVLQRSPTIAFALKELAERRLEDMSRVDSLVSPDGKSSRPCSPYSSAPPSPSFSMATGIPAPPISLAGNPPQPQLQ